MTILEALKSDKFSLRITNGNRWLVADENGELTIYERKYNQKFSRVIVQTNVEEIAVKYLLDDSQAPN